MAKEQESVLLRVYVIFTVAYFLINLTIASFSKFIDNIVDILANPYIIFCIVALIVFAKNKYDKITYSLPALNILFMAFTFGIGTYSFYVNKIEFGIWWQILIHIVFVINIILGIYIIRKLNIKVWN